MPEPVHNGHQGAVGVEFSFQQTAPRHHCVGIVNPSMPVRLGVFNERGNVGHEGFAKLLFGAQPHSHLGSKLHSAFERQEVVERLHPAGLGGDVAVQAASLLGNQICAGRLAEVCGSLFRERNLREEAAGVQILLHGEAAPPAVLAAEVLLVDIMHRGRLVNNAESAHQTQHHGGN